MTSNEYQPIDQDNLRLPRVAAMAGNFVIGLESADDDHPISVNTIGDSHESLSSILATALADTDAVYARHEELFYPNGEMVQLGNFELEAILDNTRAVLGIVGRTVERQRALVLGMGTAQLGEMALAVTAEPTLLAMPTRTDSAETQYIRQRGDLTDLSPTQLDRVAIASVHSHAVTERLFQARMAPRIVGDMQQIPFYKFAYPGFALDTYYRFWESYTSVRTVNPQLKDSIDKLLDRFPAKTAALDGHTLLGRPTTDQARQDYVRKLRAFNESLHHRAPYGFNASGNFADTYSAVYRALDATADHAYDSLEGHRIVASHTQAIGRLSERSVADKPATSSFRLVDTNSGPELVIGHPTDSAEMSDKLRLKSQKGGICPARNIVPVPIGGRTHQGAQALSKALQARTGLYPPFAWTVSNEAYVDPAAIIVGLSLLGIIENS